MSDRVGRKPVIFLNLALSAAFTCLIAFIHNYLAVLVLVFFIGVCAGMSRPATNALIGDIISENTATKAYGILYWAGNLGFVASSVIGGAVAMRSFTALFMIDAGTCLCALAVLVFGLSGRSKQHTSVVKRPKVCPKGSANVPTLATIISVALLCWVIQTQAWAALPLTIVSRGMSSLDWGFISAANGLTIIVAQPIVNRIIEASGARNSLAAGCVIIGIGFSTTPLWCDLLGFLVQTATWSIGEAFVATTSPALIAMHSDAASRGRWMGYSAAAFSLASIVGPGVGGWCIENDVDEALWLTCAILGCLAALLAMRGIRVSTGGPNTEVRDVG